MRNVATYFCLFYTVPDEEKIEKRAGKIAEEFKALVFPDGYQPGSKRKVRAFFLKHSRLKLF